MSVLLLFMSSIVFIILICVFVVTVNIEKVMYGIVPYNRCQLDSPHLRDSLIDSTQFDCH